MFSLCHKLLPCRVLIAGSKQLQFWLDLYIREVIDFVQHFMHDKISHF